MCLPCFRPPSLRGLILLVGKVRETLQRRLAVPTASHIQAGPAPGPLRRRGWKVTASPRVDLALDGKRVGKERPTGSRTARCLGMGTKCSRFMLPEGQRRALKKSPRSELTGGAVTLIMGKKGSGWRPGWAKRRPGEAWGKIEHFSKTGHAGTARRESATALPGRQK